MSEQSNGYSRDEQNSRPFNPNEHVVQIKTKDGFRDYLPVQWRLVWFREQHPEGIIETEMLHLDLDRETEEEVDGWNDEKNSYDKVSKRAHGFVVFRAVVKDGKGGVGTGTKTEKAASFPDFIEKAETGAIGRALAALGFGTQFAPELDEEHRIVDSPVKRSVAERNGVTYNSNISGRRPGSTGGDLRGATQAPLHHTSTEGNGNKTTGNARSSVIVENPTTASATEKQLTSIRKLCEYLGRPQPENQPAMSYAKAKELIDQLTLEYRQRRSAQ
jgi:hypothetical protein